MSELSFTEGPWKVFPDSDGCEWDILDSRCGFVARATRASNARLIAAAPELLEAIERLYRAYSGPMDDAGKKQAHVEAFRAITNARIEA